MVDQDGEGEMRGHVLDSKGVRFLDIDQLETARGPSRLLSKDTTSMAEMLGSSPCAVLVS